jgi:hypothetical protein
MEAGDHYKNGASRKILMSRRIFYLIVCCTAILVYFAFACNGQNVNQDDAVAKIFGDSVARIIYSPKSVNVYTLKKAEGEPNKKVKTINGYEVVKELKNVSVSNYAVLQFLMKDTANYQLDSLAERKCYFVPYLAYEFVKGKEKATVIIAFNCECLGVLYKGELKQKPYTCARDLIRVSYALLPDDKYLKKLLSYFND